MRCAGGGSVRVPADGAYEMSDVSPALDPARLADLRALAGPDMPDLAAEVARLFVAASQEGVARLEAGAESGDCDVVAYEAHQLKGSGANVGAVRLAEQCGAIEQRARNEAQIDAERVQEVAGELARVIEALHAEFAL